MRIRDQRFQWTGCDTQSDPERDHAPEVAPTSNPINQHEHPVREGGVDPVASRQATGLPRLKDTVCVL